MYALGVNLSETKKHNKKMKTKIGNSKDNNNNNSVDNQGSLSSH